MSARALLDLPTTRRVACDAGADPKTVDRVLLGMPTRGTVRRRILAALIQSGLVPLLAARAGAAGTSPCDTSENATELQKP